MWSLARRRAVPPVCPCMHTYRRAAALTGQPASGFVLSSAVEHAQDVIDPSNRIELSAAEFPSVCRRALVLG
jgi:hypothetical protein